MHIVFTLEYTHNKWDMLYMVCRSQKLRIPLANSRQRMELTYYFYYRVGAT